eukprot:2358474-Rhodomonas_salina.1
MSGTEIAYGAGVIQGVYVARLRYPRSYSISLRACYAIGLRACYAVGLRACYAMSGTNLACGAIRLRACYAMSGTDVAYGGTRVCAVGGISLRRCYAMSGTDIARLLRTSYAMSGTDAGNVRTALLRDVRAPNQRRRARASDRQHPGTLSAYAMSGTDLAYGALWPTRCPVLTYRLALASFRTALLRDVRY